MAAAQKATSTIRRSTAEIAPPRDGLAAVPHQTWPCCTNRARDSLHEFSMTAGRHEQSGPYEVQDHELVGLQYALKRRGSLTIWFDPDMTWRAPPTGKRGRQPSFSDAAIQTCLTMKVLFGMPLRQTRGFVQSLLKLVGLDWVVPPQSSRHARTPSPGTRRAPVPSRATKLSAPRSTSAEPSGDDGAATIAGAGSKAR